MRYIHTVLYEVQGTNVVESPETVVLDDRDSGVWACLTRNPNPQCLDADESVAVSTMLLRFLSGGGPGGSFEERLAKETQAIQATRAVHGDRTYLVFHRRGEVPDWDARAEHETEELVVRLNGAPHSGICQGSRAPIANLLLSLALVIEHPLGIRRCTEAVVYYRDDGKKVFAKKFEASANATVSSRFPEDGPASVRDWFDTFRDLRGLSRVLNLFAASLEAARDPLRSFLAGWNAIEIFVNKVFREYEQGFFDDLRADTASTAHSGYVRASKT